MTHRPYIWNQAALKQQTYMPPRKHKPLVVGPDAATVALLRADEDVPCDFCGYTGCDEGCNHSKGKDLTRDEAMRAALALVTTGADRPGWERFASLTRGVHYRLEHAESGMSVNVWEDDTATADDPIEKIFRGDMFILDAQLAVERAHAERSRG